MDTASVNKENSLQVLNVYSAQYGVHNVRMDKAV